MAERLTAPTALDQWGPGQRKDDAALRYHRRAERFIPSILLLLPGYGFTNKQRYSCAARSHIYSYLSAAIARFTDTEEARSRCNGREDNEARKLGPLSEHTIVGSHSKIDACNDYSVDILRDVHKRGDNGAHQPARSSAWRL